MEGEGDEEGKCLCIWESGHACPVPSQRCDVKLTSLAVTRGAHTNACVCLCDATNSKVPSLVMI